MRVPNGCFLSPEEIPEKLVSTAGQRLVKWALLFDMQQLACMSIPMRNESVSKGLLITEFKLTQARMAAGRILYRLPSVGALVSVDLGGHLLALHLNLAQCNLTGNVNQVKLW